MRILPILSMVENNLEVLMCIFMSFHNFVVSLVYTLCWHIHYKVCLLTLVLSFFVLSPIAAFALYYVTET